MGKLIVVPTPIGNLKDITVRAKEILSECSFIFCEDTRIISKLLRLLDIPYQKLVSFHKFNEHKKLEYIIDTIQTNLQCALVSDAGTPAISDPGYLLVRACLTNNIPIEVLPGATALIPALVLSGFPCERFFFEGFLPPKKGRKTRLETLKNYRDTLIFYVSIHKIKTTLKQFVEVFGAHCPVSVSRELTKMYEETFRGTLEEALSFFEAKNILKGEFVVVLNNRL